MSTLHECIDVLPWDRPGPGLLGFAERGWIPDWLLRWAIRTQCRDRLRAERAGGMDAQQQRYQRLLQTLGQSAIALHTAAANEQHYELPPEFFQHCLGKHLKYSCAYYTTGHETLDQAEEDMLDLYAARAELADGQNILELGCGWGSLTLYMARAYPHARITAVSNSARQRQYIEARCAESGLRNVQVVTQDVNALLLEPAQFDRCVSIEMFEHVRNYDRLLERVHHWLLPGGKLFVHIFAHRSLAYPFETEGRDNWLGRFFFTGGLMPAVDTLLWFQRDMQLEARWLVPGTHYRRTAADWLRNMDAARNSVLEVLTSAYGAAAARLWFQRWRIFWMACAELFGYAQGEEWLVAHYRFVRRD